MDDLIKKLNLITVDKSYILHAPLDYELPEVKTLVNSEEVDSEFNWVQAFYYYEEDLTRELPSLEEKMANSGMLWICWPKRSAKMATDLSDNVVRSIGLACGLVDTKVASIDETWSALKFVYRLKDR